MADYDYPDENRYSTDDEWVRADDDSQVLIGITDYAQQQLGDIVFVETPQIGTQLNAGDAFGVIESVKAVSDLYCPISGRVVAVNEALEDAPEVVNQDCYGDGWIITLEPAAANALENLMSAVEYQAFVAERSE